jgi:hypothetical protein
MSCLPSDWTEREHRLMRAFRHAVYGDHPHNAVRCAGCREVSGFLTVPGYRGDTGYPTCVTVYDSDPGHYRDERAGLKHGHDMERR